MIHTFNKPSTIVQGQIFLIIPQYSIGERFSSFGRSGENFGHFKVNLMFFLYKFLNQAQIQENICDLIGESLL